MSTRLSDLPQIAALQAGDLVYVVRAGVDYALLADTLVSQSTPDYAGIQYTAAATITIDLADVYHKADDFTVDGIENVSEADFANGRLIFGASRAYGVLLSFSAEVTGSAALFEAEVFRISQTTAAITGITQATPGVVTAAGHGLHDGDKVKISGVVGMTEVNDHIFTVAGVAGDDFELNDNEGGDVATGGYGAWTSGGVTAEATGIVEINRDFPNGSVGASGASFQTMGVAGDAVEVYLKNEDSTNDITVSHCHLWIFAI
jgi:hypothetical protein